MKKTFFTLIVASAIGLTACGGSEPTQKEAGKEKETPKKEEKQTKEADKEKEKPLPTKEEDAKAPAKPVEKKVDDDVSD